MILALLLVVSIVVFCIFAGMFLSCWNESLNWWCFIFGADLGETFYNFNLEMNNNFKNFWK